MARGLGTFFCILALGISPLAPRASGEVNTADAPVAIEGVGAAHGLGMAMDGVEGEARAGWSHDRILDLFYPGTSTGHASGPIRVGLATGPSIGVELPEGGVVSDAARGSAAGPGFPIVLQPGAHVALKRGAHGIDIVLGNSPSSPPRSANLAAEPAASNDGRRSPPPSETNRPAAKPEGLPTPPPAPSGPPHPQATPPPAPSQAPPVLRPAPTKPPKRTPAAAETRTIDDREVTSVWVWGAGEEAIVGLDATHRRYRGTMEISSRAGALSAVNHVDLETYVAGIAEEKGQGWPQEGLEALAIGARSLGAATMSWYSNNRENGFDICPTAHCQLYIGYDGEERSMSRAVAATSGQIRTYNGRPILAMYHGNGGGQTESYRRVTDNGSDPYPYLRSVKYPLASPSHWTKVTTLGQIESSLRAANVAVPGRIERIRITERGDSPRVIHLAVDGTDGTTELRGTTFADALELRSTWFDFVTTGRSSAVVSSDILAAPFIAATGPVPGSPTSGGGWTALLVGIVALVALATAAGAVAETREKLELIRLGVSRALLNRRDASR